VLPPLVLAFAADRIWSLLHPAPVFPAERAPRLVVQWEAAFEAKTVPALLCAPSTSFRVLEIVKKGFAPWGEIELSIFGFFTT
jgi:hypothetical protein